MKQDMPTDLYRHFDQEGRLLYVGISLRAIIRQATHKTQSPWWNDVVKITVENFPSRESALAAEKQAVENENPLHNKHFKGKPFRYKSHRKHGYTIELPGAAHMAEALVDWYLNLRANKKFPKALEGLADKFDQETEAGHAYATAIRALEKFHCDAYREDFREAEKERSAAAKKIHLAAWRKAGGKPGPRPLIARMDAKTVRDIKKDLEKPNMSWMNLHKKYGYSVTTLRKYFLEYRQKVQVAALDKETE